MRKSNVLNNKKGVSLVFVVLVLVVLSILSTAIFTLFESNMRQAQRQVNVTRAYYLALGGVEATFAALIQGDASNSILSQYFDVPINEGKDPIEDSFELGSGSVNVIVSTYVEEGNRWILITSTGTLDSLENESQTVEMRFRLEYPEIQIWN